MMLSNSLQWANKFGAQRKAAHPSPMGRRQWSAQRCAEQQKVRKFQDHLGLVRGTKSKIEDGYATGTSLRRGVAVGDFAGAQRLRLQLVPELSHFFCSAQR